MGLKEPKMIQFSEAANLFTLTPDTGESIRITNIQITPNAAVTEFLTLMINRQTVGYFHVGTGLLNQLPWGIEAEPSLGILRQLQNAGIPMFYPVAEGETFKISAPNNWTRLLVEYELYDASDIKSSDINGSTSEEYYFLNYGTNAVNITGTDFSVLTSNKNPVEFPDFPFGAQVPANVQVEILGFGMPDVTRTGVNPAADTLSTRFLRFFRDRKVLFDDARNGFPVLGASSGAVANTTYYGSGVSILPYGGHDCNKPLSLLPTPLSFTPGDELSVQVSYTSTGAGATVQAGDLLVCLPMHVKKA